MRVDDGRSREKKGERIENISNFIKEERGESTRKRVLRPYLNHCGQGNINNILFHFNVLNFKQSINSPPKLKIKIGHSILVHKLQKYTSSKS